MCLQDFIDATPDGTPEAPSVLDFDGMTLNEEETIRVTNRHWMILRNFTINADTDGSQTAPWLITTRWPRNRSHLRVDGGSSNILVENVTVSGANPNAGNVTAAYVVALEAQHAFDIDGATDVTLRSCRAYDPYGDFVYVRSSNVVVEDCAFDRNGRQGIAITHGSNIRISRCTLDNMRRSCFNIEPNTGGGNVSDVVIEDCVIGWTRFGMFTAGGNGLVSNVTIQRNTMHRMAGTPVIAFVAPTGGRRGPFTVTDNYFLLQGSPTHAIRLKQIDGFTMSDNTFVMPEGRKMTALWVFDSTDVWIANNDFQGAAVDVHVV